MQRGVVTIWNNTARRTDVHVEIADNEADRQRGLSARSNVPDGTGMLFLFPRSDSVDMTMTNTLVPLDMLFIDAQGVVRTIHASAQPGRPGPFTSGVPIAAVLEVPGGWARANGVAPGAQLEF